MAGHSWFWFVTPAAALAAFSVPVVAQQATGFLNRTVSIGGKPAHYQVYVPLDYTPARQWPVILFLHGAGERGTDGLLQTQVGLGTAIRQNASWFPAIVVLPQAPPDSIWRGSVAKAALAALEQSIREFHGDRTRLYLTGLSMGGYGVWTLALQRPRMFAAIVAVCGGLLPPRISSSSLSTWTDQIRTPRWRGALPVSPHGCFTGPTIRWSRSPGPGSSMQPCVTQAHRSTTPNTPV